MHSRSCSGMHRFFECSLWVELGCAKKKKSCLLLKRQRLSFSSMLPCMITWQAPTLLTTLLLWRRGVQAWPGRPWEAGGPATQALVEQQAGTSPWASSTRRPMTATLVSHRALCQRCNTTAAPWIDTRLHLLPSQLFQRRLCPGSRPLLVLLH